MIHESESETILRRATAALAACRDAESDLRIKLAEAMQSTKRAKEKYEEAFSKAEAAECARRKEYYLHGTK